MSTMREIKKRRTCPHGTWEGHEIWGCCCRDCVDAWKQRGKELERMVRDE